MTLEQKFIHHCDAPGCLECAAVTQRVARYEELLRPFVPGGWSTLNGYHFCPRHKLSVLVDAAIVKLPL